MYLHKEYVGDSGPWAATQTWRSKPVESFFDFRYSGYDHQERFSPIVRQAVFLGGAAVSWALIWLVF